MPPTKKSKRSPSKTPKITFTNLNPNILAMILNKLQNNRNLFAASATSKRFRQGAQPALQQRKRNQRNHSRRMARSLNEIEKLGRTQLPETVVGKNKRYYPFVKNTLLRKVSSRRKSLPPTVLRVPKISDRNIFYKNLYKTPRSKSRSYN